MPLEYVADAARRPAVAGAKRRVRRLRPRSLCRSVLFLTLCALWTLPALAIITPDEPTSPKPTAAKAPTPSPVTSDQKRVAAGISTGIASDASAGGTKQGTPSHPAVDGPIGTLPTSVGTTSKPTLPTAPSDASAVEETSVDQAPLAKDKEAAGAPSPTKPAPVEVVHERYVRGRGASGTEYFDDDDLDDRDLFGSSSFEIEDSDTDADSAPSSGKRQNYASLDAGATILDSSPELKSPTNLLVPDKDRYMLMPCEKPRKWVVVSLSEDVHADAIAVANFEKFSSTVKEFIVLGSVNYPTDTWFVLGNFTAAQQNGEQIFPLDSQHHVRYIKLRFFSHYGSEYYCTLSQLKVYGRTFTQVISQLEKSIDAESALDAVALPLPLSANPGLSSSDDTSPLSDEVASSERSSRESLQQQCSADENTPTVFTPAVKTHGTCSSLDAPKQSPVRPPPFLPQPSQKTDNAAETELTSRELAALEALHRHVDPSSSTPSTNTTAATGSTTSPTRTNGSASAAIPSAPANPLHAQGLGRLESIFVRITKKIQQLELNQSMFARQLEETHAQQRALSVSLHAKQDAVAAQIQDVRAILTDMRARMENESVNNEHYRRLVDELQKENIALWNEMLIVREVITTMKAAILCALALSACIIVFYLLRLLLRCIQSAKRRADLREWFWRMESLTQQQHEVTAANASESVDTDPVGSWRVNYKKQFGSSWDDLAIERKTLLRDLVDDEASSLHTIDGSHRSKRMRTASLVNPPKLKDLIVQMELAHLAAEAGALTDSDPVLKEEYPSSSNQGQDE